MVIIIRAVFVACLALLWGAGGAVFADSKGYRIYISADMEGLSGAVTDVQLMPGGSEYQQFRKIMTNEVLAAIEGARAAGATSFVLSDSHGIEQNIILEDLPEDVTVVRGLGRPLGMMEGIQNGHFDGVIMLGYHAGAADTMGVRAHTMSSSLLSDISLNGTSATEGYFNAAIAGDYKVPVLMITGDDVIVGNMSKLIRGIEGVTVKKAISFHAAETVTPAKAYAMIRAGAERAVKQIGKVKPFVLQAPIKMDITFHFYQPAEMLSWLPIVDRLGSRTVRVTSKDMSEASKMMGFILGYSSSAKP
ncbi:M55 family metallopeptidase [Kordiimonas pumila]|uniref:M55 family metallopeptidase n=1 Tax=Kordiimonas pumila TaxID=2161677 RepID=A0ABV7D5Z6_9PROT|nr:M55 family metallopeptidase [Kordiimonas pumila]